MGEVPVVEEIIEGLRLLTRVSASRQGTRPGHLFSLSARWGSRWGNHPLALALWRTPLRGTRILATLIAETRRVSANVMESWALRKIRQALSPAERAHRRGSVHTAQLRGHDCALDRLGCAARADQRRYVRACNANRPVSPT
jgi:hypothetical protein